MAETHRGGFLSSGLQIEDAHSVAIDTFQENMVTHTEMT